jgi:pyruvate formate-lyase activating enzyme-like uncharacterized protein
MRKLFFTLAFVFVASFGFANENIETVNSTEYSIEATDFIDLKSNSYTLSINENVVTNENLFDFFDCTLKGKFKITFADGDSIEWEGSLTIVGQSCSEFLKEMMQ